MAKSEFQFGVRTLVTCVVVLASCAGQPNRSEVPETVSNKEVAQAARTAPGRDAPLPCHLGAFEQESEDVSLRELAESPQNFENRRVRVTGYVSDLYELASIADGAGRYAVSASWGDLNVGPCRRRNVIAEGVFRNVPHSRFKHVLEVKALRDKTSESVESRGSLQTQGGMGGGKSTNDSGAPVSPPP